MTTAPKFARIALMAMVATLTVGVADQVPLASLTKLGTMLIARAGPARAPQIPAKNAAHTTCESLMRQYYLRICQRPVKLT